MRMSEGLTALNGKPSTENERTRDCRVQLRSFIPPAATRLFLLVLEEPLKCYERTGAC